eukprot:CAMPEP_0179990198 /NCGR_PEP_ID=MMETSP0984-20121128/4302_1 /TAXON_ID=483367 /ORGANISM="non described non described, Strain CCMP 2436" /LENGTH=145 /DNA_ID=CAMNT_0021909363 /DNA_START=268 /DNA_END=702 /DNA_ORIENTATION=+
MSKGKWPQKAAVTEHSSSHSAPFARSHCSTCKFPPEAAAKQLCAFNGQPFARAHATTPSARLVLLDRPQLQRRSHGNPTDSHLRAPIVARPGGHHELHSNRCLLPRGSRSRVAIAVPPIAHRKLQTRTYSRSTRTRWPAPISKDL